MPHEAESTDSVFFGRDFITTVMRLFFDLSAAPGSGKVFYVPALALLHRKVPVISRF
jgi:hypothetical protein